MLFLNADKTHYSVSIEIATLVLTNLFPVITVGPSGVVITGATPGAGGGAGAIGHAVEQSLVLNRFVPSIPLKSRSPCADIEN